MQRKIGLIVLFTSIFAFLTLACPGPAGPPGPQGPPGPPAEISPAGLWVSPVVAKPGGTITILGAGFTPHSIIVVELIAAHEEAYLGVRTTVRTLLSTKVTPAGIIEEITSNPYGAFKLEAKVPAPTPDGVYLIEAVDEKGIKATFPLEVKK